MFEEEYVAVAEAFRREIDDPAYRAYLDGIDARETHQGYFSVDRAEGPPGPLCGGKDRPQEPNLLRRGRL